MLHCDILLSKVHTTTLSGLCLMLFVFCLASSIIIYRDRFKHPTRHGSNTAAGTSIHSLETWNCRQIFVSVLGASWIIEQEGWGTICLWDALARLCVQLILFCCLLNERSMHPHACHLMNFRAFEWYVSLPPSSRLNVSLCTGCSTCNQYNLTVALIHLLQILPDVASSLCLWISIPCYYQGLSCDRYCSKDGSILILWRVHE